MLRIIKDDIVSPFAAPKVICSGHILRVTTKVIRKLQVDIPKQIRITRELWAIVRWSIVTEVSGFRRGCAGNLSNGILMHDWDATVEMLGPGL
jgi:hypothetical protein